MPDPDGTGTVFRGRLTEDFENDDPESVHLHPDVYFDAFRPGTFTVRFDVRVDDLRPDVLGPYRDKPWLNVVTLFDRTTRTGDPTFAPSVMVNLVGSPGAYFLQAYSMSPDTGGTFFEKLPGTPVFPTGRRVSVKVDVWPRCACGTGRTVCGCPRGPTRAGPALPGRRWGSTPTAR